MGRLCAGCGRVVVFEGPKGGLDCPVTVPKSAWATSVRPFVCPGFGGLSPLDCIFCPGLVECRFVAGRGSNPLSSTSFVLVFIGFFRLTYSVGEKMAEYRILFV